MGYTKAYLKRKAINRAAAKASVEKRRREREQALADQDCQVQQDSTNDGQQALAGEAAAENATAAEDGQQTDEGQLHRLASVAAAAAAAGVVAAGQEVVCIGGPGSLLPQVFGGECLKAAAAAAVEEHPDEFCGADDAEAHAAAAAVLVGAWPGLQQPWSSTGSVQQAQQHEQQQQQQQAQGQLPSARSRHTPAAQQSHDWAAYGLPTRLTTQEMDFWHNEGLVLPQFQLDCYSALLGLGTICDAADWLQMHAAEGSSLEAMGASLLSWLLPSMTPDKSCEGYEQLIHDTAATLHPLIQIPPSQVLLQATARSYAALATSLQQHQQQAQQLAAAQQVLQPDQQGVPVMDARGQHSSSQAVADWLRQQQAAGRLAAAVLMPHHSCAAGGGFAKRVLAAHMPVAFPGLGAGGFQEPVMMRGTGFAKLNLLLELAVARWASVARDSIAALSSLPPLDSMEGYAALSAAVRASLVGSTRADACVARAQEAAQQAALKAATAQASKPGSAAAKRAADAAAANAAVAEWHAVQAEQAAESVGVSKEAVAAAGKAAEAAAALASAAATAVAATASCTGRAGAQQTTQQHQGDPADDVVMRVPYIYNANPCDKGTADDSLLAAFEALGLLTHFPATSGSKLKTGFTWLTASPAAEQAAAASAAETGAAAAAAAASHGGSSRLPPVYGCHATNTSAQLDLDAAAQTLAAVPAADAVLVQLRDDGLGQAVRAFGRAGPRPVAEHRLLEANLFGILLPVMILSTCLTSTRWHVEDLGLGAMNVMAWGAPKLWLLATTQSAAERLLALLEHKLGGQQEAMQRVLHKQLLFHDISLQEALGCGLVPFLQQPGTALFTLPGLHSLHVTVSSGFSVAVSGNNFFSSSSSLQQHMEGLAAGPQGGVLFPSEPAEGGWDQGHVEARLRLAPLMAKLAEAQHSTALQAPGRAAQAPGSGHAAEQQQPACQTPADAVQRQGVSP